MIASTNKQQSNNNQTIFQQPSQKIQAMKELVLFGFTVILPCFVVFMFIRAKINETNKKTSVALAAIEKDSVPNLDAFFKNMNRSGQSVKERMLQKLLWGSIFSFLGMGIYLAFLVQYLFTWQFSPNVFTGLSFVAIPSLAVGLAFLLNYYIGKKVLRRELEAETKETEENLQEKA